jgi:hypothetical protein
LQNLRSKAKQSVGISILDSFYKSSPEEARSHGVREQVQSKFTTKLKEEKRDRACEYIAQ